MPQHEPLPRFSGRDDLHAVSYNTIAVYAAHLSKSSIDRSPLGAAILLALEQCLVVKLHVHQCARVNDGDVAMPAYLELPLHEHRQSFAAEPARAPLNTLDVDLVAEEATCTVVYEFLCFDRAFARVSSSSLESETMIVSDVVACITTCSV